MTSPAIRSGYICQHRHSRWRNQTLLEQQGRFPRPTPPRLCHGPIPGPLDLHKAFDALQVSALETLLIIAIYISVDMRITETPRTRLKVIQIPSPLRLRLLLLPDGLCRCWFEGVRFRLGVHCTRCERNSPLCNSGTPSPGRRCGIRPC